MTIHEAYKYILVLLDSHWVKTRHCDLDDILGEMIMWQPLSSDEKSVEPALHQDWVDAVEKVTIGDSLNETQALQTGIYFLRKYKEHQGLDLKDAINFLEEKLDNSLVER